MICNMMKGTDSFMTKESFVKMCDLNFNNKKHNKNRKTKKKKGYNISNNFFCVDCETGVARWAHDEDVYPSNINWTNLEDMNTNETDC